MTSRFEILAEIILELSLQGTAATVLSGLYGAMKVSVSALGSFDCTLNTALNGL